MNAIFLQLFEWEFCMKFLIEEAKSFMFAKDFKT